MFLSLIRSKGKLPVAETIPDNSETESSSTETNCFEPKTQVGQTIFKMILLGSEGSARSKIYIDLDEELVPDYVQEQVEQEREREKIEKKYKKQEWRAQRQALRSRRR